MERKKNMGVKKTRISISKNNFRPKTRIRLNFRNIVPAIVDYLKSDSYFYSHLMVSSSSPYDYAAPHDVFLSSRGKPVLKIKDSVNEKLVEYLKSDMYLYAPLERTQYGDDFAVKTAISPPRGQELQFMRVTSTVLSKKISWQTKEVAENPVVEKRRVQGSKGIPHDASVISPQTPALQEVKKHSARRSSRLSTASG